VSRALLLQFVNAKIVFSVFRFIANVIALGAVIIGSCVLGFLAQRERAKELVAQIRRAVKGDPTHTSTEHTESVANEIPRQIVSTSNTRIPLASGQELLSRSLREKAFSNERAAEQKKL
jgi:hypothetical protein